MLTSEPTSIPDQYFLIFCTYSMLTSEPTSIPDQYFQSFVPSTSTTYSMLTSEPTSIMDPMLISGAFLVL